MEQQTPEEEHQDQRLQGCHTYHPLRWFRVVGHLQQPPTTPLSLPSVLPPHHPEHPLEQLHYQRRGP